MKFFSCLLFPVIAGLASAIPAPAPDPVAAAAATVSTAPALTLQITSWSGNNCEGSYYYAGESLGGAECNDVPGASLGITGVRIACSVLTYSQPGCKGASKPVTATAVGCTPVGFSSWSVQCL